MKLFSCTVVIIVITKLPQKYFVCNKIARPLTHPFRIRQKKYEMFYCVYYSVHLMWYMEYRFFLRSSSLFLCSVNSKKYGKNINIMTITTET